MCARVTEALTSTELYGRRWNDYSIFPIQGHIQRLFYSHSWGGIYFLFKLYCGSWAQTQ